MSIIETKDITKTYTEGETETKVLKGISFKVEKGEFVAIMGPSGSGKSTLLHILGLLDSPSGGDYVFNGKSIASFSENDLSELRNEEIGFIFQAFNLQSKTSVLENVKLPLMYSNIPEEEWIDRALSAIEAVGMSHRIKHEPSELSGGEKQRVAIARALVTNPHVIFADEPTGNLDSKSGKIVMDIIQKLNEEQNRTVLLITHETYTAEHAQRIIRIQDGQIVSDEKVIKRRKSGDTFIK